MLGKVIGAVAGRKLSRHVSGVNGPGGALLGVGAASVAKRLGPTGMVVAAVGGWALKRYMDKSRGGMSRGAVHTSRKSKA